jgi:polo-like kinase 1
MELKVGDFGLATKLEFEGERKRTVCGTPNYIAPEILDGKTGHSYEVDIWSLGVILYTLIIGKPPFETQDVKTTYKRIKMNSYTFPEKAVISDSAKALITEILCTDPLKRPGLDDMLRSDFFNLGTCIPKLLPTSTLACPPSLSFIRQFMPEAGANGLVQKPVSTTQRAEQQKESVSSSKNLTDRNKLQVQYNSNQVTTNTVTNSERPLTTNFLSNTKNSNNTLRDSIKNVANTSDKKLKTVTGAYPNMIPGSDIYVKKWVDYSSKYGLGYLLSNGFTGVVFNDSSKIILDVKTNIFNYIERRSSDKQEIVTSHSLSDYPQTLQKKVTLLQHFKSYLEGENNGNINSNLNTNMNGISEPKKTE